MGLHSLALDLAAELFSHFKAGWESISRDGEGAWGQEHSRSSAGVLDKREEAQGHGQGSLSTRLLCLPRQERGMRAQDTLTVFPAWRDAMLGRSNQFASLEVSRFFLLPLNCHLL